MNTPTPDQLKAERQYHLLMALPHADLNRFTNTYYFWRITWIILAHYAFSAVLIIGWLLLGVSGDYESREWLRHFALAALIFVLLVPVHEFIHAMMYRMMGAPTVQIAVSLRRLYVYAIAPDFVMDRAGFAWVLVMPFLAITVGLTLGMAFWPAMRHVLLGTMLIHTGATSGDFAMLNYLWQQRKRVVLIYDDAPARISYFYERVG